MKLAIVEKGDQIHFKLIPGKAAKGADKRLLREYNSITRVVEVTQIEHPEKRLVLYHEGDKGFQALCTAAYRAGRRSVSLEKSF